MYGAKKPYPGLTGQCLHAVGLRFIHPRSGEEVRLKTELPDYFLQLLSKLGEEEN